MTLTDALRAAAVLALALLFVPDRPTTQPPPATPAAYSDSVSDSFGAYVTGPQLKDGVSIACEIPAQLHQKNTGGSDGAGLCVYASARHTGLWQNTQQWAELFHWMKQHPGGSYPSKFKNTLEQFCKEKNLPVPPYLQVESNDLEILKLACKTGRMPGVTYGISPTGRYGGSPISHMVSLVHADDKNFVILDNNYIGENNYECSTPEEFLRSYKHSGGQGWAIILLTPPPPAPPRN